MVLQVPSMQQLLEAGVHFGHKVSRAHPKMNQYIYGARDGVSIIDLAQSEEKLKEAASFAYNLGKSEGVLLVVGTKKQAREIVENLAKEAQTPYLISHWLGGLLTNFDEIKKNLNKLSTLKEEKEKGELKRYTKKEQLLISRKLEKFERDYGGIATLNKVPDAMFVVDAVADLTAVKEAYKKGIKIVGFADTNSNPSLLDYPIPANDDGIKSIKIICEAIIKIYEQGKKEAGIALAKAVKKEEAAQKKQAAQDSIEPEEGPKLDKQVAEEAAVLEEAIEKKVLEESERKVE